MEKVLRYGVFPRGSAWVMTGPEGPAQPFASRREAVEAALWMREMHEAKGTKVEVLAHDGVADLAVQPR